jgi:ornithine--oxo-acid transaminase
MVFTANAGLVRNGMVALSSFHHLERQGEEPHFRKWFHESGFAVREIPRATPFEGEGDALFEAMAHGFGLVMDCEREKTATGT